MIFYWVRQRLNVEEACLSDAFFHVYDGVVEVFSPSLGTVSEYLSEDTDEMEGRPVEMGEAGFEPDDEGRDAVFILVEEEAGGIAIR